MNKYFDKQVKSGKLRYVVEQEHNATVYMIMDKYPFEEEKYDFIKYAGTLPVFKLKETKDINECNNN